VAVPLPPCQHCDTLTLRMYCIIAGAIRAYILRGRDRYMELDRVQSEGEKWFFHPHELARAGAYTSKYARLCRSI
jgi:hypothetical protein